MVIWNVQGRTEYLTTNVQYLKLNKTKGLHRFKVPDSKVGAERHKCDDQAQHDQAGDGRSVAQKTVTCVAHQGPAPHVTIGANHDGIFSGGRAKRVDERL